MSVCVGVAHYLLGTVTHKGEISETQEIKQELSLIYCAVVGSSVEKCD